MEVCRSCGHPFGEDNGISNSPAEILGDLFQESVSPIDDSDICPSCKEKLGLFSIMNVDV